MIDEKQSDSPQIPADQAEITSIDELRRRYADVRSHVRRALHDITNPKEIRTKRKAAFIAADSVMQALKPAIEKSKLDLLTNLPNYDNFQEILETEAKIARENGEGLLLIFVDLNRFKKINTILKHEGANKILRGFGQIIKDSTRPSDIAVRPIEEKPVNGKAARYGGDEFLLLLRGSKPEGVYRVFDRLVSGLQTIPERQQLLNKGVDLTISVGVSNVNLENPNESIMKADEAMYAAKRKSKRNHNSNQLNFG